MQVGGVLLHREARLGTLNHGLFTTKTQKTYMESNKKRKLAVPFLAAALVAGIGAGGLSAYAQSASAADINTPTTTDTTKAARPPFDPSKGGHIGKNGVKEELLTGDIAEKAKAAALAAVPGGTIERVENDADGATYEAHMTKADGSHVTVLMDANFAVTATETGGPGGHGDRGPRPAPPTTGATTQN
jgi:uncharacterized membrane protein YkoI